MLCVAGAGAKADPTRVRILDVAESAEDPLARAVRQRCAYRSPLAHIHVLPLSIAACIPTSRACLDSLALLLCCSSALAACLL